MTLFNIRSLSTLILSGTILLGSSSAFAAVYQVVSDGVGYARFSHTSNGRAHRVHAVKVDIKRPDIEVRPALAYRRIGQVEPTSGIARREGAIVAMNASFFNTRAPKLPIGLLMIDREILTRAPLNRSALGITQYRSLIFGIPKVRAIVTNMVTRDRFEIWAVNRPRKTDEVILYTSEYGLNTKTNEFGLEIMVENGVVRAQKPGNSWIPPDGYVISLHGGSRRFAEQLPPGTPVRVTYQLSDEWLDIMHAVTGGPRLVRDGDIVVKQSVSEENFRGELIARNSRTAVGVDRFGKFIMVMVEGKKPSRRRARTGMLFTELAGLMKSLGCVHAVAFDGGSSSTMVVAGRVILGASAGYQPPVSNAIIVRKRPQRES